MCFRKKKNSKKIYILPNSQTIKSNNFKPYNEYKSRCNTNYSNQSTLSPTSKNENTYSDTIENFLIMNDLTTYTIDE
jgi:uncharacterized membrane protein required for colicin V production